VASRQEIASREKTRPPPVSGGSTPSVFVYLSYHTTHTTKAERRAEKQRQRLGGSSGQKIKRGIEGEFPYTHTTQAERRAERSSAEAPGGQETRRGIDGEEPGRMSVPRDALVMLSECRFSHMHQFK